MGLSYRWIKDVGPGPQGWVNAQSLDFPFCVTNFSIISVNQGKINNGMKSLSCLPSVPPTCAHRCHLQGHLLRKECCEEIHLCGSTSQMLWWWCWRWACMSLLTLSPSHTHILFGVNKLFRRVGTLRNSYLCTNWATTQKEWETEQVLLMVLEWRRSSESGYWHLYSLSSFIRPNNSDNNFPSCSRANSF